MAITINRYPISSSTSLAELAQTLKTLYDWVTVDEADLNDVKLYFSTYCYLEISCSASSIYIKNSSINKSATVCTFSGSTKYLSVTISSKGIAFSTMASSPDNTFIFFIGNVTTIDGETAKGGVIAQSTTLSIFTDNCTNTTTQNEIILSGDDNKTILYPIADIKSGDKFNDIYTMYSSSLTKCLFTLNDKAYVCGQYAALSD